MPDTITSAITPRTPAAQPLVMRVFEALERDGIPYCLLHGNQTHDDGLQSDVDFIVPPADLPHRVRSVLSEISSQCEGTDCDGTIVQWLQDAAHFIVLTSGNKPGSFLQLHPSGDFRLRHRPLYTAAEILASRRLCNGRWIPAARIEFTCMLAKRLVKRCLQSAHQQRLLELYQEDPEGCREEIDRFFSAGSQKRILAAVAADHWGSLVTNQDQLRRDLLRRLSLRKPLQFMANVAGAIRRRIHRWWRRDRGLNIVFLGVDGSGKSSVLQAVRHDFEPLFTNSERRTFPPGLRSRGPAGTNSQPHEVPLRSPWNSAARALLYWLPYYTLGHYFFTRRALLQNELIVHDRHLIDALVDSKRYRYGGPRWLLQTICRLIPKADLTILLDAPADVVRQRKQEVSPEETERQIDAYRTLIKKLSNSHTVDASQPIAAVIADVEKIILAHLSRRAANQFVREART